MKIPKYIINRIYRIRNYYAKASQEMDLLEEWRENHGVSPGIDGLRDGSGVGLDELEYGVDDNCVEDLIERIKEMYDANWEVTPPSGIDTYF